MLKVLNNYYYFSIKKFILVLIFIFIFYIYKLNVFINNKINNNNFLNIPTIIYSRIININNETNLNKNQIIKLLISSKYIKKDKIRKEGEFSYKNKILKLFKRSFHFPHGYENKSIITIKFNKNYILSEIKNSNNNIIKDINIEPQIITIIDNLNSEYKLYLPRIHFPDTLIDMLIEIEDKKYYIHNGINCNSIIRAFLKNIYKFRIIQGGSTLTQQLCKNIFLHNKKTFIRKINEMFIAFIIEYKLSKDKILELYLNEVFFGKYKGKDIKGFPLASICYFGKYINELDLNEQASLVGMIKGASLYNPWKNPNLVIKRKNFILEKIKNKNIISNNLYKFLINQNFNFISEKNINIDYPSFKDLIKKDFKNKVPKKLLLNNDLKIFSTLDIDSQINAQNSVKLSLEEIKKNKKIDNIEISMLIIDVKTGEIKSSIGGSEYDYYGYNRIFSKRQIGSLIKPILYAKALDNPDKFNLNTYLCDTPLSIKVNKNKYWKPNNNDKKFRGKVKLIDSIINSLNIPTINLGFEIGIDNFINTLVNFGINKNDIKKFPSIFLGAIDLNILEIAQMYHILANYGNFINLHSIKYIMDKDNNILYSNNITSKKIISSQSSYLTLFCMKEITKQGTAKILYKKFPNLILAGKTGTTNKFKDSWFVGIDHDEICIVWLGKDDNSSIYLNGSEGAMYIYEKYINMSKPKSLNLIVPDDIYNIYIDDIGNFVCNKHNYKNYIPIWTKNPNFIIKECKNHNFIMKYFNNLFN